MDLAQVKASVKAWERAFKAKHQRDPTKEDIKADNGGIAEQYALYRTLSKAQAAPSSSTAPSSSRLTSSASSTSQVKKVSNSTPRTIPNSEYPTTPTPPSRRQTPSQRQVDVLKPPIARTMSDAPPQASSSRGPSSAIKQPEFKTPKKPQPTPTYKSPYSAFIVDPNPFNPFIASPTKPSPFKNPTSSTIIKGQQSEISSPFIHANTPKKLKQVLEVNSLQNLKKRSLEAQGSPRKETPRSKARKRLRGEVVDWTPQKDIASRRRRGEGPSLGGRPKAEGDIGISEGKKAMTDEDHDMSDGSEEDEEGGLEEVEEDEFGPSPMKANGASRAFTALLGEAKKQSNIATSRHSQVKGSAASKTSNGAETKLKRSDQPSIQGFFGKQQLKSKIKDEIPPVEASLKGKERADSIHTEMEAEVNGFDRKSSLRQEGDADHHNDVMDTSERLSTPPVDEELEDAASQPLEPKSARKEKVLKLSDEETENHEAEDSKVNRELVIVPTRRQVIKAVDEWDIDSYGRSYENTSEIIEEVEDEPELNGQTSTSPTSPSLSTLNSSAHEIPPHLLSLLSLQSPSKRQNTRKNELMAKALFDPQAALALKAMKKGQDVHVSGEGDDADVEDVGLLDNHDHEEAKIVGISGGAFEDDDWDSDNEGWKKTGEEMEDW